MISRPPRGFGNKELYEVYITSKKRVAMLLKATLPYLIVKREKAARLLTWIQQHPNTREENMTHLNKNLPRDDHGSNLKISQ